MPDIEDDIIVAAHVVKALIEKLYRAAKERRNEKVQEDMKNILEGFTKELQKGVDSREELKSLLDKQKDKFLQVKKDMGINDAKKLDMVLKNVKERIKENTQSKFEFTLYDANVVFNYIENSQGSLSETSLKEQLNQEYPQEKYRDQQLAYLTKRLDDNCTLGTVRKTEAGNYMITDEGKSKAKELKDKKVNIQDKSPKKDIGRNKKPSR